MTKKQGLSSLLFTIVLTCFATTASATPIGLNILSEINHISGCADADNCYDQISVDPISGEAWGITPNYTTLSRARAGDFEVFTQAGGFAPTLVAEAISTSLFTVSSYGNLLLDVFVDGSTAAVETGANISLINTTLGQELLSIQLWDDFEPLNDPRNWTDYYYYSNIYSFIVDPNYEYELTIYSYSYSSEDVWNSRTRIDINMAPIPEPTTMLLFITALAGLAGSRFRRKQK